MRSLVALLLAVACSVSLLLPAAAQTTKLRIATCARTITAGLGAPFAIATKMGWFKAEGHRGRDRAAARLDRLREDDRDQGSRRWRCRAWSRWPSCGRRA